MNRDSVKKMMDLLDAPPDLFNCDDRDRRKRACRWAIFAALRTGGASWKEIAAWTTGKTHATAIHCLKRRPITPQVHAELIEPLLRGEPPQYDVQEILGMSYT